MTDVYKGMPKALRIGGFIFNVVIGEDRSHEQEGSYGHMNPFRKRISLRSGMDCFELANTFMHEVIHAIHWNYGLLRNNSDEEIQPSEEEYTTLLANGMCAFWQDNQHAVKWWQKLVTEGFR